MAESSSSDLVASWPPESSAAAGDAASPLSSSPAAVELHRADDDEGHRSGRRDHGRRHHEGALHGAEEPPGVGAFGQRGEDLVAPLLRKLERRGGAERQPAGLEPVDLLRARAAADEMLGHVAARVVAQLLLDEGEQVQLVGMLVGHQSFDSVRSAGVPNRSASSLRPRKMRDFTVPSGTSVISAISA